MMSDLDSLAENFRDQLLYAAKFKSTNSIDVVADSLKSELAWHELSTEEKMIWSRAASSMLSRHLRSEKGHGDFPTGLTFSRDS